MSDTTPDLLGRLAESLEDAKHVQKQLLQQAAEIIITTQLGSQSLLERRMRCGHIRATRLMTELENNGIVGPLIRVGVLRTVLVKPEQLDEVLNSLGSHPSRKAGDC